MFSPFVAKGGVTNQVMDHTSIVRYLIDTWNLVMDNMGNRVKQATTFAHNLLHRPRDEKDCIDALTIRQMMSNIDNTVFSTYNNDAVSIADIFRGIKLEKDGKIISI